MPMMRCRVVCALEVMIERRVPRMAFISVDLPTFGLPTMLTKPARWSAVSRYGDAPAGATSMGMPVGMDVASASAMTALFLSLLKKAAIRSSSSAVVSIRTSGSAATAIGSSGSTAVSTATSIRGTESREAGRQRAREGAKEHAGRVATTSKAVARSLAVITICVGAPGRSVGGNEGQKSIALGPSSSST